MPLIPHSNATPSIAYYDQPISLNNENVRQRKNVSSNGIFLCPSVVRIMGIFYQIIVIAQWNDLTVSARWHGLVKVQLACKT